MLKIGSLQLSNWLIMAPMAGITNLPFRMIVKKMGAALVTTEMISAKGLVLGQERTLNYLRSSAAEKPLSVQLFGADPAVIRDAAQLAVRKGADIIDINLGCPVKKIVKTGAGAALLREPQRIKRILSVVRNGCPVPLTAKIRAGWNPQSANAISVARLAEDCGVDAITIHPRFASQGYSGKADWSLIGRMKEAVRIPVVGNGDVLQPSHAIEMRAKTGCDGVMIGRSAIGNPWIFKHILLLEKGIDPPSPGIGERRDLIMEHFEALSRIVGKGKGVGIMRGLLLRHTKGLPFSSSFRERITGIKDMELLVSTMRSYFSSLEGIAF